MRSYVKIVAVSLLIAVLVLHHYTQKEAAKQAFLKNMDNTLWHFCAKTLQTNPASQKLGPDKFKVQTEYFEYEGEVYVEYVGEVAELKPNETERNLCIIEKMTCSPEQCHRLLEDRDFKAMLCERACADYEFKNVVMSYDSLLSDLKNELKQGVHYGRFRRRSPMPAQFELGREFNILEALLKGGFFK